MAVQMSVPTGCWVNRMTRSTPPLPSASGSLEDTQRRLRRLVAGWLDPLPAEVGEHLDQHKACCHAAKGAVIAAWYARCLDVSGRDLGQRVSA